MSLVDDQVRRLDAILDRIQLAHAGLSVSSVTAEAGVETSASDEAQSTEGNLLTASSTDTIHAAKLKTVP